MPSQTRSDVLHVGILLVTTVQYLDMGPVDMLSMMTPEYLGAVGVSERILAKTQKLEFHYISESEKGSHVATSAHAQILITDSIDTVGHLDILLIPGPEFKYVASEAMKSFIRQKFAEVKYFITICTGIVPLVQTGVLDGKEATGTRLLLPFFREQWPAVNWVEKKWIKSQDGKLWISAGITNGMNMMVLFLKENFDPEVANIVCEGLVEIEYEGQEYTRPMPSFV